MLLKIGTGNGKRSQEHPTAIAREDMRRKRVGQSSAFSVSLLASLANKVLEAKQSALRRCLMCLMELRRGRGATMLLEVFTCGLDITC